LTKIESETFVTLFDENYIAQGLALYSSLISNDFKFTLYILCLDKKTYEVLKKQNKRNIKLLKLEDFENDALKEKKLNRTKAEYCWTLTSWSIQWCLELDPKINRVTYLDADLYFLKTPISIFNELDKSMKKVLITKHSYSPEYDQSFTSGIYCVQFLTITRGLGEKVLHEWRDKCMDWCYAYHEDGKYGDQKYLDSWPLNYPDIVKVYENESGAQAPWNATRFPYSDAIFYHFHGFKIISRNKFFLSTYLIPKPTYLYVYKPYIKTIKEILVELLQYGFKVKNGDFIMRKLNLIVELKNKLRNILRKYLIPTIYSD